MDSEARKLEIGPGDNPLGTYEEGWLHARWEDDVRWGYKPLPYRNEVFSEVYASHVLEHIPWTHTQGAVDDVHRILKPGGKFEVWVPDFSYIVACYQRRECGDSWRRCNPDDDPMTWVNGRIFTYGPGADNWHHAAFDARSLIAILRKAGFANVQRLKERTRGTPHGNIDLGVIGTKC